MKMRWRFLISLGMMILASIACQTAVAIWEAPTHVPTFVVLAPTAVVEEKNPTDTPEMSTDISGEAAAQEDANEQAGQDSYLLLDDFSDSDSGLGEKIANSSAMQYTDGGYRISINDSNFLAWSTYDAEFENVRIEVEASFLSGSTNNTYGIICGYKDANNFYSLMVGSDGYFAIRKRAGGGTLDIISGDSYLQSDAIRTGTQLNLIAAVCSYNRLALFANGELLTEVIDDELETGQVGVIAGTFEGGGTEVFFDNFRVKEVE